MSENYNRYEKEIFNQTLKSGKRTYFFDVRETRAGDYYLTITESKKHFHDSGEVSFEKHKIYLYKEDFEKFQACFDKMTSFITEEKGHEVIGETHRPDFSPEKDLYGDATLR